MARFLIIVDLEGCTGVTDMGAARFPPDHGKEDLAQCYREICTAEVLAVIDGLESAGHCELCVYESHPYAIIEGMLPAHVEFRRALQEESYLGVASEHWDGVILLSMECSPVIMITGGMCLANEIALWCPTAQHVVVKRDLGWERADSMKITDALTAIKDVSRTVSVGKFSGIPISPPFSVRLTFIANHPRHVAFRTAWLLKRWLINRPSNASFDFLKGSLEIRGNDPRVLMNKLMGKV